jgi:hypothetical protein
MFRSLDHAKLLATIHTFRAKIEKMFPGSGLGEVAGELEAAALSCFREIEQQGRPLWKLRAAVGAAVLALLLIPAETLWLQRFELRFGSLAEFVQAADAGFNVLLLIAAAVLFLVQTENRLKRNRTFESLNELRALAHVIDMHQLCKDPGTSRIKVEESPRTNPHPKAIKNENDMWFYLSLCTDLLAVTGKLAACFARCQNDRIVLDSIHEIEMLTTALSRKIWQKMSLLERPWEDASAV